MSAIFVATPSQREQAEESHRQEAARNGGQIHTEILPLQRFYRAEDYHQKYYLRQNATLAGEFKEIYPDAREFTDSTATARINGYLGGHVPIEEIRRDIDGLGLSPEARERLLEAAER